MAHQLSLLLVAAVLAIGSLSVWNLRSGFIDYLRLRDEGQLTRLMQGVAQRAAAGTWERAPMPTYPETSFAAQWVAGDAQGSWQAGRQIPQGLARAVRAVQVSEAEGTRPELPLDAVSAALEAQFLQRQYAGLALVGAFIIALSMLVAWWVAGRWSRPSQSRQPASREMAHGQPTGRQAPSGMLEMDELTEDVHSMADGLTRLENARRLWLAQIFHELHTPMAVLRTEIESIEHGARQPTQAVMTSLRDEVLQLSRLVNDLHMLSMAELDKLPCKFEPGDASAALLRSAQRYEARAAHAGLRLQVQDVPAIAACWDFGRIEQLLGNLIENSLRYTEAPGRVVLRWKQVGKQLQLTLDDTAPSVTPGQALHLFEPRFGASGTHEHTPGQPGGDRHDSGLGLSIAQAIVLAHGGSIWASASPLGGLAIHVILPLQAACDTPCSTRRAA